ncbi:hypothetical protein HDU96_008596, partial [Phlyctochytrium bullatum]
MGEFVAAVTLESGACSVQTAAEVCNKYSECSSFVCLNTARPPRNHHTRLLLPLRHARQPHPIPPPSKDPLYTQQGYIKQNAI